MTTGIRRLVTTGAVALGFLALPSLAMAGGRDDGFRGDGHFDAARAGGTDRSVAAFRERVRARQSGGRASERVSHVERRDRVTIGARTPHYTRAVARVGHGYGAPRSGYGRRAIRVGYGVPRFGYPRPVFAYPRPVVRFGYVRPVVRFGYGYRRFGYVRPVARFGYGFPRFGYGRPVVRFGYGFRRFGIGRRYGFLR